MKSDDSKIEFLYYGISIGICGLILTFFPITRNTYFHEVVYYGTLGLCMLCLLMIYAGYFDGKKDLNINSQIEDLQRELLSTPTFFKERRAKELKKKIAILQGKISMANSIGDLSKQLSVLKSETMFSEKLVQYLFDAKDLDNKKDLLLKTDSIVIERALMKYEKDKVYQQVERMRNENKYDKKRNELLTKIAESLDYNNLTPSQSVMLLNIITSSKSTDAMNIKDAEMVAGELEKMKAETSRIKAETSAVKIRNSVARAGAEEDIKEMREK